MRVAGLSVRSAIGAGIMIGQIGEFSFVLASAAYRGGEGAMSEETYRLIVAVAVLSVVSLVIAPAVF